MLWLKRHFDPKYYDRKWLAAHHVGAIPRAQKPAKVVVERYQERRQRMVTHCHQRGPWVRGGWHEGE